ncbi:P-loop containing nucleoside triphosphate hydrolase protein [Laetiporus sulphureus 93-53]|uniref:p-loop containing nucleoside triphosphate hydrolase protein n=1 Tax=Laetiporus sulphureus 93-53 TaxID=1314785 RepID=A0A165FFY1_9APHY|nr:P-loop containing nucleoside triphosphate hydrolase protein [Laetiporus sulphureus 93-53]KZT08913.1 P-loop containing nucleoside triphosphate hydrolase protein [Laetiporus sulphureus 93-53]
MRRPRRQNVTNRKGTFNPEDTKRVKHMRIGVWDYYTEKIPILGWNVPGTSRLEHYFETTQSLPYVWQMMKDISGIRNCWTLLIAYVVLELINSMIPAASLWFSGQLLTIVQTAVDTRTVDKDLLLRVSLGRMGCAIVGRLLSYGIKRISYPLSARLKQHYSVHLFYARARLDLPTFEDPAVQRQLEEASTSSRGGIAWDTFSMVSSAVTSAVLIVSQVSVLAGILRTQLDGPLLACISLSHTVMDWLFSNKFSDMNSGGLHQNARHEEIEFQEAAQRVGDRAGDFWEVMREYKFRDRLTVTSLLKEPWKELPQIVFALRAVQYPASIPVSLASLNLIQQTTQHFGWTVYRFIEQFGSIADQLATVRKLYNIVNIPNRVPDGNVPFPEDTQKVKGGISVEFKNVSFRYPGAENYAVRDLSFRLSPGQLCVIVGANGSGKSTILKLLIRLYDVEEGEILIDGRDIRSFRLTDLRQSVSVLFQDYTHFPLSIRDNIALGNPADAKNDDHVRLAAKLGGAEEFIERLPEGFDTYLDRPVNDYYSSLPEGTRTLFGRPVDFSAVRGAGRIQSNSGTSLSGGQMQRLAVARSFMRSVVSEESTVGLLLFDEPSASLDPTAEHDLFARLRDLRGNKTMLFSSHRFGNLTKHADLILYINDSVIVESGTHQELLKRDGEYARIWNLQAQAFL